MTIVTLMVSSSSDMTSWIDLKDKTVCIDSSSDDNYYNFMKFLFLLGYSEDDVTIVRDSIFSDSIIQQFQAGSIDALYITTIHPNEEIYNLYNQTAFRFIGIEGLKLENVHMKSPFIQKTMIDLRNYNIGIEQGGLLIEVFGIPLCIITKKSTDITSIYRFTNALFENIEYLKNSYKELNESTNEQNLSEMAFYEYNTDEKQYYKIILSNLLPSQMYNLKTLIPLHEGTKQYFIKKGLITYNSNIYCANFLPEGSPNDFAKLGLNCNNQNANLLQRHFGHGHFG